MFPAYFYFNLKNIQKNFEIDYWGVSNKNLNKKIIEHANKNNIVNVKVRKPTEMIISQVSKPLVYPFHFRVLSFTRVSSDLSSVIDLRCTFPADLQEYFQETTKKNEEALLMIFSR